MFNFQQLPRERARTPLISIKSSIHVSHRPSIFPPLDAFRLGQGGEGRGHRCRSRQGDGRLPQGGQGEGDLDCLGELFHFSAMGFIISHDLAVAWPSIDPFTSRTKVSMAIVHRFNLRY